MMIEVEQTYQEKFDMYMAAEKEELVKMLIECNNHLKVGARIEQTTPFPQKYTLEDIRKAIDFIPYHLEYGNLTARLSDKDIEEFIKTL